MYGLRLFLTRDAYRIIRVVSMYFDEEVEDSPMVMTWHKSYNPQNKGYGKGYFYFALKSAKGINN